MKWIKAFSVEFQTHVASVRDQDTYTQVLVPFICFVYITCC